VLQWVGKVSGRVIAHHLELAAQLLEAKTFCNQIHEQFAVGLQDLLLSNQAFLTSFHSLDQVLHHPIPAQQQWLAAIKFAHSHGHQQCTSKLQQMHNSMAAFCLGPLTLPPPEFIPLRCLHWHFLLALNVNLTNC